MIEEQLGGAARRLYDTVAGIADVLAPHDGGEADRDGVVRRIIHGYLNGTRAVELTINHRSRRLSVNPPPVAGDMFSSTLEAMGWFRIVRPHVQSRRPESASSNSAASAFGTATVVPQRIRVLRRTNPLHDEHRWR